MTTENSTEGSEQEEPIECVLDRLSDNLSVAPTDVIRLRMELGCYDE